MNDTILVQISDVLQQPDLVHVSVLAAPVKGHGCMVGVLSCTGTDVKPGTQSLGASEAYSVAGSNLLAADQIELHVAPGCKLCMCCTALTRQHALTGGHANDGQTVLHQLCWLPAMMQISLLRP